MDHAITVLVFQPEQASECGHSVAAEVGRASTSYEHLRPAARMGRGRPAYTLRQLLAFSSLFLGCQLLVA